MRIFGYKSYSFLLFLLNEIYGVALVKIAVSGVCVGGTNICFMENEYTFSQGFYQNTPHLQPWKIYGSSSVHKFIN